MQRLIKWAYSFLRWVGGVAWMGSLLAWVLRQWGERVLMKRIFETEYLQAFHHPVPSYPVHILIIPKDAIESLMSIEPGQSHLLTDVLGMLRLLIDEFGLEQVGYRLIVNGGPYQEVAQLHFHLVSNSAPVQSR